MSFYGKVRKLLEVLFLKALTPTKVFWECEDFPEGPVVLCANHTSAMDVLQLIPATPRKIRFMAKKELFKIPLLGSVIRAAGAFPVDRKNADVSAVKNGMAVLKEGEVLGIFPQGTRCPGVHPNKTYGKLRDGAVMMALKTRATLFPAAIRVKKDRQRIFRKVTLIYGRPIPYEEYAPLVEGKNYTAATSMLFDRICELYDIAGDKAGEKNGEK